MVYRVDGRRADHGSSHGTPGRDVLSDGVFSIHLSSIFKVDVPARRACGTKGQATKVFGRQGFRGKYRNPKVRMIFPESPAGAPALPHREKAFDTFARQFLQALRCWNIRDTGSIVAYLPFPLKENQHPDTLNYRASPKDFHQSVRVVGLY